MEVGKGENFRPAYTSSQPAGYTKSAGFSNTVAALLGFTTILGAFSGIGVWARLSYRGAVLDVPFTPTYRLSVLIGWGGTGKEETEFWGKN